MSQITKKNITPNAVDQSKVRLDNNSALRGRNAANDADLNLIKANASNKAQIDLELDMNAQAISNVGNVDGRDVSADGTALDSHLNGGINKHDATEVDYERSDGSKKNIAAASDDAESAITNLDDAIGALDATPTNYTPANPAIVADHLAAIDSQLASNDNKQLKVSANDTTPGYLEDKVVSANSLLTIATLNDGGNEDTQFTVNQGNIDHGSIAGLADDDHTQYHNDTRGDARYYQKSEFVTTATAGAPVKLDGAGKISAAQLTVSAFEYLGNYNATTNSPALVNGTGSTGDLYHVSVAGSQDFGAGSISFSVGDKVVYNGSIWEKWDLTESVSSVNGATGVVTVNAINQLTGDVTTSAATQSESKVATIAAGAVTGAKIASDTITNSNINSAAAIAYSKLSLSNSIVNADINSAAAIAYSKLALSNSIVNADIAAGAAIADSKLATISTANKVSGSAVQLNASGALEDSTGLKVRADASTIKINGSNNLEGLKPSSQKITLSAGDITAQFVDLAFAAYSAASISLTPIGGIEQEQAVDYTVALTGGAGGVTRLTFAGDLATGGPAALVAADKIVVKYSYLT